MSAGYGATLVTRRAPDGGGGRAIVAFISSCISNS